MLVMTFLSMLSDSITAVLNISLHTSSVPLLMRIFLTCSLITPTPPPVHPTTIVITPTLYPGRLSNLKGELLRLLSFLLILFQDILLTWASHIYQMYYLTLFVLDCDSSLLAVGSFLILYSKSQLIFTCSFFNTAPCPHLTL